jgi:hypothetical protein
VRSSASYDCVLFLVFWPIIFALLCLEREEIDCWGAWWGFMEFEGKMEIVEAIAGDLKSALTVEFQPRLVRKFRTSGSLSAVLFIQKTMQLSAFKTTLCNSTTNFIIRHNLTTQSRKFPNSNPSILPPDAAPKNTQVFYFHSPLSLSLNFFA